MKPPFEIIKDFEDAVAEYTGSKYCVAVNSCTNALFLSFRWWKEIYGCYTILIPKRTYVSVPMQALHAGHNIRFKDIKWMGNYQLNPTTIWDYARCFKRNMCAKQMYYFVCTSHHWSKPLGIQHGGCILHDCEEADVWFRKARLDGRTDGLAPKDDMFDMLGWHCPMPPENAAAGLVRLSHFGDGYMLPNDKYPDLSKLRCFK